MGGTVWSKSISVHALGSGEKAVKATAASAPLSFERPMRPQNAYAPAALIARAALTQLASGLAVSAAKIGSANAVTRADLANGAPCGPRLAIV